MNTDLRNELQDKIVYGYENKQTNKQTLRLTTRTITNTGERLASPQPTQFQIPHQNFLESMFRLDEQITNIYNSVVLSGVRVTRSLVLYVSFVDRCLFIVGFVLLDL